MSNSSAKEFVWHYFSHHETSTNLTFYLFSPAFIIHIVFYCFLPPDSPYRLALRARNESTTPALFFQQMKHWIPTKLKLTFCQPSWAHRIIWELIQTLVNCGCYNSVGVGLCRDWIYYKQCIINRINIHWFTHKTDPCALVKGKSGWGTLRNPGTRSKDRWESKEVKKAGRGWEESRVLNPCTSKLRTTATPLHGPRLVLRYSCCLPLKLCDNYTVNFTQIGWTHELYMYGYE